LAKKIQKTAIIFGKTRNLKSKLEKTRKPHTTPKQKNRSAKTENTNAPPWRKFYVSKPGLDRHINTFIKGFHEGTKTHEECLSSEILRRKKNGDWYIYP